MRDWRWLLGAVVLFANLPYTFLVILPTNNQIISTDIVGPNTRALIEKWGRLHAVRTLLGAFATCIFFWASMS